MDKRLDVIEAVKKVIDKYIKDAKYGIYNTKNIIGDIMRNVYYDMDDDITVDICFGWGYFEVFGLNDDEWKEIENYYEEKRKEK